MDNEQTTFQAVHGHVGTDPKTTTTANGTTRLTFRLGIPRRVENSAGELVNTDPHYVTVAMYGKSAERTLAAIAKGDNVIAIGGIRQYEVTDPERGPRVVSEFRAQRVGHDLNLSTVNVVRRGTGISAGVEPGVTGARVLPAGAVSARDQLEDAGVVYPANWNEMGSSEKDLWEDAALQSLGNSAARRPTQRSSGAFDAWQRAAAAQQVPLPPPGQEGFSASL